jgi:hypothetical protein
MISNCTHLDQIKNVTPSADGCKECLAMGVVSPTGMFGLWTCWLL